MFGRSRFSRSRADRDGVAAVRRAAELVCERLEPRLQLTVTVDMEDGITDGYDHIAIYEHDGNTTGIVIAPGGTPVHIVFARLGEPINIYLAGGDDIVEIGINGSFMHIYGEGGSDFVDGRYHTYPLVFWAGTGHDRILAGTEQAPLWNGPRDTTVYGEGGNDTVIGSIGNDYFDGGDGDDSLEGNNGDDTVIGGVGNDTLRGATGKDILEGGDGNDYLVGGSSDDAVYGQAGNDTLVGSDNDGSDTMHGGGDTDRLDYSSKTVVLSITLENTDELFDGDQDGADSDDIRSNIESVIGGSANDAIVASQTYHKPVTLRGGAGDDTIKGGAQGDSLLGEDGNDNLDGNDGNDMIRGGAGIDSMYGDTGDDTLDGQNDDDDLFSGGGGIDTALADLLPNDPKGNLYNVETVTRA